VTAPSRSGRRDPAGNRVLEILAVALLGIATVGTAWCAYQAAQWNGEQGDLAREAADERLEASRLFGLATQAVAFDANMVAQYAQAVVADNEDLQAFYRATLFRAEFLPVLDRWEAEIADGGVPTRLLEDEEYLAEQLAPYEEATSTAEAISERSEEAGRNADDYVLVTVLLATSLFFAGVTTSFRMRTARLLLLAAAGLTVAYSASLLVELPVV
jgi:hypothetical protein